MYTSFLHIHPPPLHSGFKHITPFKNYISFKCSLRYKQTFPMWFIEFEKWHFTHLIHLIQASFVLRGTVKVKAETEIPKLLSRSWEKLYYITVCCRIEVFLNRDHRIVAKTVKQQKYLECRSFHRHKIHSITFFVFLWLWFLCLQTQLIITEEEREWARWWMLNNSILDDMKEKTEQLKTNKHKSPTMRSFL